MAKKPSREWPIRSPVADVQQILAPFKDYYLILYNALSCLGWAYILVTTCLHLANVPLPEIFGSTYEGPSALSLQALVGYIQELVEEIIKEAKGLLASSSNALIASIIPLQLLDVYNRMITTYDVVGGAVAIFQTAAALEIFHSISGLVKSPIPTAVIQVYSRLFLVWGVTQKYEQVRWQYLFPITMCLTCPVPSRVTARFTRP